ncbi:hypothetical protein GCM10029992_08530 [Glycomyces albus]
MALLDRWEAVNEAWAGASFTPGSGEWMVEIARRNAALDGYVSLFAGLTGAATAIGHPAHAHLRIRYRSVREFHRLAGHSGDAARVAAIWDGLQVISLYRDEVDIPGELADYFSHTPGPQARSGLDIAEPAGAPAAKPESDQTGYAAGREKRSRIVAAAVELFAQRGFAATSLSEIADRVGTAKSTILHHFGSKEKLLEAVLTRRDELPCDDETAALPPREFFREIIEHARSAAARPGLIELYTVLSCEATAADHPAHDYFARRFDLVIRDHVAAFERLQASGELAPGRDPEHEGLRFVALWDGLQVQWLFDPDSFDIAAELRAHLEGLLADPPRG